MIWRLSAPWSRTERKDMEWRAATHKTRLIRALVLALLFCLPGLAQPLKNDPHSIVKDGSDTPIKIGALLPFSGGVELYGEQAKLGIDLAGREINSKGESSGARCR